MKRDSAAFVCLAGLLVLVGCGNDDNVGSTEARTTGAPPVASIGCQSRSQVIPSRRPPDQMSEQVRAVSLVAGPVIFSGAKQWEEDSWIKRRGEGLQPTKVPMVVESEQTVVVNVSPPPGRRAFIEVGLDQAPYEARGTSVELRACSPSATVAGRRVGPRTPFLGGFRLDGPMCLDVEVQVQGQDQPLTRTIAFGKSCAAT